MALVCFAAAFSFSSRPTTHDLVTISIKTKKSNKFKLTSVDKWFVMIFEVLSMSSFSSHAAIFVTTTVIGPRQLDAALARRQFRLLVRVQPTILEQIRHVLIFICFDCFTSEGLAWVVYNK